jgi:hypothetical protein
LRRWSVSANLLTLLVNIGTNYHSMDITPKTVCEKCGRTVAGGLLSWVDHEREFHPETTVLTPLTYEDLEKIAEQLGNIPDCKPMICVGIWMFEGLTDEQFIWYLDYLSENYELSCGLKAYEYIRERYNRIKGL